MLQKCFEISKKLHFLCTCATMLYSVNSRKASSRMFADSLNSYRSWENADASADIYDNLDLAIRFQIDLLRLKAVHVAGSKRASSHVTKSKLVLIDRMKIWRGGQFIWQGILNCITKHIFPLTFGGDGPSRFGLRVLSF